MSEVTKRLVTDETLKATNTALSSLTKNTTLTNTNTALGALAKDSTLGNTNTALGALAKDSTLTNTNTALGLLAKDITLNEIAEILCSVKSVNGKYDAVVLDSGDILISKSVSGSKTVKAVLTELENAVAATPLTFTPTAIAGSENDYKIDVTVGTPS